MTEQIKIALVDDHLMFRLGVKSVFQTAEDMVLIAEAATQHEALLILQREMPDIMILDLRMPEGGGISLLKKAKDMHVRTKFLILTSYASEEEIFQALTAGASGYVMKDIETPELLHAIRTIHQGGRYVPAEIESLVRSRRAMRPLTPREMEILQLVVRGLTNKEIAQVLGSSSNTIRNHTIAIFDKIDVADRAEAVSAAFQRGLVLPH